MQMGMGRGSVLQSKDNQMKEEVGWGVSPKPLTNLESGGPCDCCVSELILVVPGSSVMSQGRVSDK